MSLPGETSDSPNVKQEDANSATLNAKKKAADIFFDGVTAFEAKDWNTSLKCFSDSLLLQPDNDDAHYYRGLTYLMKGDLDKGYEDLGKIKEGYVKHHLVRSYKTQVELLNSEIDVKPFTSLISLKDALTTVYELMKKQGKEVRILIDTESFKNDLDGPDIYDTSIRLPPISKVMKVHKLLRQLVIKIPPGNGTVLVSPDALWITVAGKVPATLAADNSPNFPLPGDSPELKGLPEGF